MNELLKQMPIFQNMSDEELAAIQHFFGKYILGKQRQKREMFLDNGKCYFVISGIVRISQITAHGKEKTICYLKEGEFFTEERKYSIMYAKKESIVLGIQEKNLEKILNSFPGVIKEINKALKKISCSLMVKIECLLKEETSERIQYFLEYLFKTFGPSIKVTHKEIADFTDLTRETVTRMFAQNGYVYKSTCQSVKQESLSTLKKGGKGNEKNSSSIVCLVV